MTPEEIEKRNKQYFDVFPRFELDRVRLREVRNEDAQFYYDYILHPEVTRFLPVDCWPDSVEWSESHMRYWRSLFINNSGICWTIADKESDNMIGSFTITKLKTIQRKGTFSYDLDYNYWGKGIMKEAIEAVVKFCDEQLDLLRIEACASVNNERSRRLLLSVGFKHEGVMPKYEVLNWNHEDFDAFGRTR